KEFAWLDLVTLRSCFDHLHDFALKHSGYLRLSISGVGGQFRKVRKLGYIRHWNVFVEGTLIYECQCIPFSTLRLEDARPILAECFDYILAFKRPFPSALCQKNERFRT